MNNQYKIVINEMFCDYTLFLRIKLVLQLIIYFV